LKSCFSWISYWEFLWLL